VVQLHEETGDPLVEPTVVSYNALINAWVKSYNRNDPNSSSQMADTVLMQMVDAFQSGKEKLKPDAVSFCTVMHAYAKSSNGSLAVRRCQELFDQMDELGIVRNAAAFSALQNVYARSGVADAPEHTRNILDQMLVRFENGDVYAKPITTNYNNVLNALSRTPSPRSAKLATEMLDRMERSVASEGYDVSPDRLSYSFAILAWARCPDGALQAEAILDRLEARALLEARKREEVSSAAPPLVTLDLECCNAVLTALSRSGVVDAPDRALRIIDRMEQYAASGFGSVRPSIRSWNAVLNTFAMATGRGKDLAQEAESILNRLSQSSREGDPSIQPNAFTFAAVLNAYKRSREPMAAHRADAIVRQMEALYESGVSPTPPDIFHYTIVCNAWAKLGSKMAAKRCLQILGHLVERDQAGYADVKPNVRTYNAVLECLCRSKELDLAEQLLYHMLNLYKKGDLLAMPDPFSFNYLVRAFSKCSEKGSGQKAEAILERFLEFHEENPLVKPDRESFNAIIAHWYNRSSAELDAPYRAEYLLNRMVSLLKSGHSSLAPTLFAITTVMESYARANHADAGRNAERLLKLIRDLNEMHNTQMTVTTTVMNSVLYAWANSGEDSAGQRAEFHLDEMETRYYFGNDALKPNSKSYGYVISAWSKSKSPEKAQRALRVLRRLETQGKIDGNDLVVVDDHAYSLVVNACAFCNGAVDVEREAFDIAVSLLNEMMASSTVVPSSLTFGWFIQACGRLRVDKSAREDALGNAFNLCCKAGLVNEFVLHRLKGATSESQFEILVGHGLRNGNVKKEHLSLDKLPPAWRRNCQLQESRYGRPGSS
jgi:pentatricopeptide repeat protein